MFLLIVMGLNTLYLILIALLIFTYYCYALVKQNNKAIFGFNICSDTYIPLYYMENIFLFFWAKFSLKGIYLLPSSQHHSAAPSYPL